MATCVQVLEGLMEKHVLVALTGTHRNVILFTPAMCFTIENARYIWYGIYLCLEPISYHPCGSEFKHFYLMQIWFRILMCVQYARVENEEM